MSAGATDKYALNIGILFLSDWKLTIRVVTEEEFRSCGKGGSVLVEVGFVVYLQDRLEGSGGAFGELEMEFGEEDREEGFF